MPVLESAAKSESPVDIHELNYATTMDFICCWLFGLGNDSNFIQDVEMRRKCLGWHLGRNEHSFWFAELPGLTRFMQSIGIRLVPKWVDTANDELQAYLLQLCRRANQSMQTEIDYSEKNYPLQTTRPVVYSQLAESFRASATKSEDGEKNQVPEETELHIASEMLDHLIAGMDTSAITLTYLLWELSMHPDMQIALRKDLRKISPTLVLENSHNLPSARSVDALPVLQSIIMETLRLHPAIPGPQPRITPSKSTSIAGSPPLPGGVRVSAQAYSLHRNEDVFGNSEEWHPKRWFFATPEQYDEMLRWFWAFGSGGRMCVGKNFALQGTAHPPRILPSSLHITNANPLYYTHRAQIRRRDHLQQLHHRRRRRRRHRAGGRVHGTPGREPVEAQVHPLGGGGPGGGAKAPGFSAGV